MIKLFKVLILVLLSPVFIIMLALAMVLDTIHKILGGEKFI